MKVWIRRVLAAALGAALLLSVAWLAAGRHLAFASSSTLGPLAQYVLPKESRVQFEGKVVERVSAGSYTYLRIEQSDGQLRWVVTLGAPTAARLQARVRIVAVGYAEHFTSKRLARSFDGLYFAVVRAA